MDILGLGMQDPEWYQVLARTVVVFVTALIFVRISGMRTFGTKSAFDVTVTITLGALLSRCITGHYPFFGCLGAAFLLAVLHRLVSYFAARSNWFRNIVSGRPQVLYNNKTFLKRDMKRFCISEDDIEKAMHENNIDDPTKVSSIILETDGVLSVIKDDKENK
ncbi:MAG: DUF421 domain-containing protein [Agriterribacter sp.]